MKLKQGVLILSGMPGAGKTTVSHFLKSNGSYIVSMGDIIRENAIELGYGQDRDGQAATMRVLREKEGPDIVAKITMESVEKKGANLTIIDGMRSLEERDYFASRTHMRVLALHASPPRRFALLSSRGRDDDPKDFKVFEERDRNELKLGLGNVIALADYMIINEDITLEQLHAETLRIRKHIMDQLA